VPPALRARTRIARLGQDLGVTQPVQDHVNEGARAEKVRRQAGEVEEGRVEEHETPLPVEDDKTRGQVREGARQGLHELRPRRFGQDESAHVGGEVQRASVASNIRHIEPKWVLAPGRARGRRCSLDRSEGATLSFWPKMGTAGQVARGLGERSGDAPVGLRAESARAR
jgi:hypothetical protein